MQSQTTPVQLAGSRGPSAASIWEVAIKASLGRPDFSVDSRVLRRGLLDNEYLELPITGAHAAGVSALLLDRTPGAVPHDDVITSLQQVPARVAA